MIPTQPFRHDPSAILDYAWSWIDWLDEGETITAYEVTAPAGVTLGTVTQAGGVVTAWLGPVTPARVPYSLVCRITTSQGRTDERTIRIIAADR